VDSIKSVSVAAVEIHGATHRYPVLVGSGLIAQVGERVRKLLRRKSCGIVSDSTVAPLFADRIEESLKSSGFEPTLITIPAGEKSKTLKQAGAICEQMIAAGLDRQSFVIGLGGGVIGDISGFVAAVYHRGIPHVQIPTTLLAMVDSSIGGKTGVNTLDGKNLIGAVHQPSLVIDDLDVLKTLPRRQFNQGFAEIIKHAIIADPKMFKTLKVARASGLRRASGTHALQTLIKRNIKIKSKIVA
jgi:3-dehydroquinate synthetase